MKYTPQVFVAFARYTCVGGVLDETAFFPNENSASPDVELLRSFAAQHGDGLRGRYCCVFLRPYSRRGVLWEQYRAHFGKNDLNDIDLAERKPRDEPDTEPVDRPGEPLLRDRAAASSECLDTFRTDIESFIPEEIVEACTVAA